MRNYDYPTNPHIMSVVLQKKLQAAQWRWVRNVQSRCLSVTPGAVCRNLHSHFRNANESFWGANGSTDKTKRSAEPFIHPSVGDSAVNPPRTTERCDAAQMVVGSIAAAHRPRLICKQQSCRVKCCFLCWHAQTFMYMWTFSLGTGKWKSSEFSFRL